MPDRDKKSRDRRRRRDASDSSSRSRGKRHKDRDRDKDKRGKDKDRDRKKKSRSRSRRKKSRSRSRHGKSDRKRASDVLKKDKDDDDVASDPVADGQKKRRSGFDAPPDAGGFGSQLSAAGAAAAASVFGGALVPPPPAALPNNADLIQQALAQQAKLLAAKPPPAMDPVMLAAIAKAKAAALATCNGDSAQAGMPAVPPPPFLAAQNAMSLAPRPPPGPALGNAIAAAHAKANALRAAPGLMQQGPPLVSATQLPGAIGLQPQIPGQPSLNPQQVLGQMPAATSLQVMGAMPQFKRSAMPAGDMLSGLPGVMSPPLAPLQLNAGGIGTFGAGQNMGVMVPPVKVQGGAPPLLVIPPGQPRMMFPTSAASGVPLPPPEFMGFGGEALEVEELTIAQASTKNPSFELGNRSSFREVSPALADIMNGTMR